MIDYITEFKMNQSRGHQLKYRDINDPDFSKEWGRPEAIIPDKEVTLELHLHLIYDAEHSHLVRDLTVAVSKINQAIAQERGQ